MWGGRGSKSRDRLENCVKIHCFFSNFPSKVLELRGIFGQKIYNWRSPNQLGTIWPYFPQSNSRFLCYDVVINIMLAFLTNTVPFLNIFLNIFDKLYEKLCYSWNICQKRINKYADLSLWSLSFCRFFPILRHNDVIKISYWTYQLRFEIRVSNVVCVLNFNS